MVQQLCVVRMVSRCATAVLQIEDGYVNKAASLLPFSVLNHKEKAERGRRCKQAMFSLWLHIQDIAGKVCFSQGNK